MTTIKWTNYFVKSLASTASEGHLPAENLADHILNHDGSEAYHCAYDLEPRDTFKDYEGLMRPALERVWFDFDSKDGGELALLDAREFITWISAPLFICFSGSKGFHVGVPFAYFNITPSVSLAHELTAMAKKLKERFKTIDTGVYNANRKFRALGTRHPKTGLYKIALSVEDLAKPLEQIRMSAQKRCVALIPPVGQVAPIEKLRSLLVAIPPQKTSPIGDGDSISLSEWKRYRQPEGSEAFKQCLFLSWCKDNSASVTEPLWYAAASIVGRFKDGRAQFQAMSKAHPGYSVTATDEKLEQAMQASGPRTCAWIDSQWHGCKDCALRGQIKSPVVILEKDVIPTEATGFYDLIVSQGGAIKRIPNYGDLLLAFRRDKKYFIDSLTQQIYAWCGTHYARISEMDINSWCETSMIPKPTMRVVNEFRAKVLRNELRNENEIETLFFETTKGKLNLKNGVLDIVTKELSPHDERLGFRYVLPYDFDPAATAPTFCKFLDEITLGRHELRRTLLEYMGYCLWPSYDDHCFLWLSGTGRNGKSTFMEIVQSLVGENNCSNVLLSSFEKTNYLQMMDHKLVNIAEESDEPKIPASIMGTLKALSAGAKVQVDQKYEVPYAMRATAKLMFASNRLPFLPGTESAIKARMIVVPFDLELEEYASDGITSKINWKLTEEIKKEMPGVLTLCLFYLGDFVKRTPRKIHRSLISTETANQIMRDSDIVEAWFQDNVKFEGKASLSELFASFKQMYDDQNKAMPQNWFARRLRQKLGKKCTITRDQIYGKRDQVFNGISLNSSTDF